MSDADLETTAEPAEGESLAGLAFEQIARDISLFANRQIELTTVEVAESELRPVASGSIHLSFKVAFQREDGFRLGCLFVPLRDAITLASLLLLKPAEEIDRERQATELDQGQKDAMLELGNMIAGALDNSLRWFVPKGTQICAASCQGVGEDRPPWLEETSDSTYVVAAARATIDAYEESNWFLVLPELFELEAAA